MNQGNLVFQTQWNSGRGVQSYRLPNQIGALWWHLMFQAELSGCFRAIHLKPIFPAICGNQPEVVQNSRAKGCLLIDDRTSKAPDSKTADNVTPQAMRAEEFG